MPDALAALRVAVLADAEVVGEFSALLEGQGVVVLDANSCSGIEREADVLLVDVTGATGVSDVEAILVHSPLPVLLNQGGIGEGEIWHQRLLDKLKWLAGCSTACQETDDATPALRVVAESWADGDDSPVYVVVLGASLGGPRALARFFQALPGGLPVSFLLVQHMAEEFQGMLSDQLGRCTEYPVAVLDGERTLRPGQVWIVPADARVTVDRHGLVRKLGESWEAGFRPSIDGVLEETAAAWGPRCGAILFSGAGDDGAGGCATVTRLGGFVWAQSPESCVIPSLPDAARRGGYVAFNGSPEELAEELYRYCRVGQQKPC